MSAPNLAHTLLSLLAVQGVDMGDSAPAAPGETTALIQDGAPVVTLVLQGVLARRGRGVDISSGLAGAGDLINFGAVTDGEDPETGLWLTPGQHVTIAAERLRAAIDPATLTETAIADLRRRNAALRAEVARHAALRVVDRLAVLLLDLNDMGGGERLGLRQSDLAALLSVRRASVSTAGAELQATGAIRVRRGGVQIVDRETLERLVPRGFTRP